MLNLILWDGKSHIFHSGDLAKGTAHYHGVTWDDDRVYVTGSKKTRYGIHVFDHGLKEIDWIVGELYELHQIFWQGKLYVINTGLNRVEVWDGSWNSVAFNPSPCDVDHLNGIWSDGERFYISEFRHRPDGPSAVRVTDLDLNLLETRKVGDPIHNVYVEDGNVYTLVNRDPAGIYVNDERVTFGMEGDQMLRGLARGEDHWYIGLSRWETERDKRHVGHAIVLVMDNEFKEVDRIVMPDMGPVCDIRLLEGDRAHNGLPFPGNLL